MRVHLGGVNCRGKYRYYECVKRDDYGAAACDGTTVREDRVLTAVAAHLENWLGFDGEALGAAAHYGALKPGDLPDALQSVRRLVLPPARPTPDRGRLERQLEKLTGDLTKARANLVLLDPDNIPAAQDRIRKLEGDRATVERELKAVAPAADRDVNELALDVSTRLYNLAYSCRHLSRPKRDGWNENDSLGAKAPAALRWMLDRTSHIVCHTDRQGRGTRTRHVLDRGEIVSAGVGVSEPGVRLPPP